jgi:hypothetical protein
MDVVWITAFVALWALLACGAMALEKLPPLPKSAQASHAGGGQS